MTAETHANLVEETRQLILERDNMESKLKTLVETLNSQTNGNGLLGSLVDSEGFPRTDVDVYNVRLLRVEIIRLQNDVKDITSKIEAHLYKVHAQAKLEGVVNQVPITSQPVLLISNDNTVNDNVNNEKTDTVLAIIDGVSPDSPSYDAGLKRNDKIIMFGPINSESLKKTPKGLSVLQEIGNLVQKYEDKSVIVVVKRDEEVDPISLTLVPTRWSGRGLLGCHIIPA